MPNVVQTLLLTLLSGVLAAVVTAFLMPGILHRHWRQQKRRELQFSVLTEANALMSDFLVRAQVEPGYAPDREFLARWLALTGMVRALFSARTFQKFTQMDEFIGGDARERRAFEAPAFAERRNEALRAFLAEVGVLRHKTRTRRNSGKEGAPRAEVATTH